MKEKENKVSVVGLADCHGLESFHLTDDKNLNVHHLSLRASFNRQRHAVIFKAVISKALHKYILHLCKVKNRCDTALKVLKRSATKDGVRLPSDFGGKWCNTKELYLGEPVKGSRKSWSLIPDSKLDPWC